MFTPERYPTYVPGVGKMYLFENDYITHAIRKGGVWEPYLLEVFDRYIQPEHVVVDVGAHVGLHTVYISKRAKSVYSFEPVPQTFELLKKNVSLNQCMNVNAFQMGLGDSTQKWTEMWIPDSQPNVLFNTGCARMENNLDDCPQEKLSISVRMERLDDWLHRLDRLDFLKVDVEGFEQKFIKGAWETLNQFRPVVVMENFRPDEDDALLEMGYKRTQISNQFDYLYTF